MLYTSTCNGVDKPHKKVMNPLAPSLIVLDKKTGRLVAADAEKISTRLWHAQWCSPSAGKVGGRTLIFFGGGDGICYAYQPPQATSAEVVQWKKVWSYDCNPPEYRLREGKPIPYYDGDRRKKRGNKNDGKYVGPSQIIATPVFYKNRVYVAIGQDPAHGRGKGMLHCIDATKRGDVTKTARIWTYDGMDRSISTVAIAGGLVYAPDIAGRLHCLDAETGQCHWVYETKAETWGSPLVADGKVYLGTKKYFFVFAAGKARPKVLAKIGLGSPVYGSAIAANGVLYVASQRRLWAAERAAAATRAVPGASAPRRLGKPAVPPRE
jgi:outer membrane protein assembly factor BamB